MQKKMKIRKKKSEKTIKNRNKLKKKTNRNQTNSPISKSKNVKQS